MSKNPKNFGHMEGYVPRLPTIIVNPDGSHNVKLTVAVFKHYDNGNNRNTEFIGLEDFIPKSEIERRIKDGRGENGLYDLMRINDHVSIDYSVRVSYYMDENTGEKVRGQALFIETMVLTQSKTIYRDCPHKKVNN